MNIISLLGKLDMNDLLQWRETLSHCADSIQSELKYSADDFTREDLEYDLESVTGLRTFLKLLEESLG